MITRLGRQQDAQSDQKGETVSGQIRTSWISQGYVQHPFPDIKVPKRV
jgi:hypothetical protein